jgi:NhaP-type Na+/H+ or K+/H+ antiporter
MNRKTSLLVNVISKSLTTAVIGLFAGLAIGLVIWSITLILSSSLEMPPIHMAAFLGMAFGTIVGGIFGGIVGLKEK